MLLMIAVDTSHGFSSMDVMLRPSYSCRQQRWTCSNPLYALTERQMQFWEDVENGLDDIESFYKSLNGQDIDRVREFVKRYSKRQHILR